jgi:hypothetical protein
MVFHIEYYIALYVIFIMLPFSASPTAEPYCLHYIITLPTIVIIVIYFINITVIHTFSLLRAPLYITTWWGWRYSLFTPPYFLKLFVISFFYCFFFIFLSSSFSYEAAPGFEIDIIIVAAHIVAPRYRCRRRRPADEPLLPTWQTPKIRHTPRRITLAPLRLILFRHW